MIILLYSIHIYTLNKKKETFIFYREAHWEKSETNNDNSQEGGSENSFFILIQKNKSFNLFVEKKLESGIGNLKIRSKVKSEIQAQNQTCCRKQKQGARLGLSQKSNDWLIGLSSSLSLFFLPSLLPFITQEIWL